MALLMVVEDDKETRKMMVKFLNHNGYEVIEAENGMNALSKIGKVAPDVILMDISMPKMNGIEATKKIKEMDIPSFVIMLTALSDEKVLEEAANAGADDFLMKPVNFKLLNARIKLILETVIFYKNKFKVRKRLLSKLKMSEAELDNMINKNFQMGFEVLEILEKTSEFRDDETHEHTQRVGWLSGRIAEQMGLSPSFVSQIQFASPLHDIGKIGIPDAILLKPGKLTEEEWKVMRKHAKIGYDIMSKSSADILKLAAVIALSHHERWNGSGYPQKLKGENIPLASLIVAIADSFDAMASKRPYKDPIPLENVYKEIVQNSAKLYSPVAVKAFMDIKKEIFEYYQRYLKAE